MVPRVVLVELPEPPCGVEAGACNVDLSEGKLFVRVPALPVAEATLVLVLVKKSSLENALQKRNEKTINFS